MIFSFLHKKKEKINVIDKPMYHTSCDTLPYGRFIEAMVSKDPVFLVISGEPFEKDVRDAWELIKAEFNDKIKTPKSESIFNLWKKINYIKFKIDFIAVCLHTLRYKGYDIEIAEEIQNLGYDLIKEDDSKEKYMRAIHLVETAAKSLKFQLNIYVTEYNLTCPQSESITQTIDDYNKELAIIQKFMGFRIDKETITVTEYCGYFNLFIEQEKQK
jgi:hypothetical protein